MTTRVKTRRAPAFGMALVIVALSLFVVFVAATSNAAADNGPSDWSSFGIDASTKQASSKAASNPSGSFANAGEATLTEASVLETSSSTDISAGIATIEEEERIAEEARKAAERATIEAASAAQANYDAVVSTNLPDVDWTVGEEKFVAEWGSRIDAYLAAFGLRKDVRAGRLEQPDRSALVAGNLQHGKQQGLCLLQVSQRLGLGQQRLVQLGGSH